MLFIWASLFIQPYMYTSLHLLTPDSQSSPPLPLQFFLPPWLHVQFWFQIVRIVMISWLMIVLLFVFLDILFHSLRQYHPFVFNFLLKYSWLQCCINFCCIAVIQLYIYILFHCSLSLDIEYGSLCYTVGTCLPILYIH